MRMNIKRILTGFIFLITCLIQTPDAFSYVSAYLDFSGNPAESELIKNTRDFALIDGALIASGVKKEYLQKYRDQFAVIIHRIETEVRGKPEREKAELIFEKMHQYLLKNYRESSTTLDVAIRDGTYNCLSSTVLYNSLLEHFGIKWKAVVLSTHTFSRLYIGDSEIDVENTSPNGFHVNQNPEAQKAFKKTTGMTYDEAKDKMELTGTVGMIAYTYANIAYFANEANLIPYSFQSALKGYAVHPEGRYVLTNVKAVYNEYALYLTKYENNPSLALKILEEAITNLGADDYRVNYYYCLDRQIGKEVDNGQYMQAFETYLDAEKLVGANISIKKNLYIRLLNRLSENKDYETAYEIARQIKNDRDTEEVVNNLIKQIFYNLVKNSQADPLQYPAGEDEILKWYELGTDSDYQSILENYYSKIGIFYYENGDVDKGVEILSNGLNIIQDSKVMEGNQIFILVNASIQKLEEKDYETAVDYLKRASEIRPDDQAVVKNLNTAYQIYAYEMIKSDRKDKAAEIIEEGLKIFPGDQQLTSLKQYLDD